MKRPKHLAKQVVLATVVASMAAASPVWAETTTMKTSFPDVAGNHWGLKHITKLALEGVIQGDDKGFHPEDAVSQQDAVIMVIRALGLESEALKINADAAAIGLDVRSDAKRYVIKAIDKGILDIQEELSTVADKSWGSRNASREWIAKLVIRSIDKKDEATGLSGNQTAFKDNADISAAMRGFVNAAIAHKIVDGFDDGTFKPKGDVTRAQLATILSRSDKEIPYHSGRVVSGYVQEMSAGTIKLTASDGGQLQYSVGTDTVFYSAKNETNKLAAADIKPQNLVNVIQNGGKAYYIEIISDVPPIETIEGTVDEVKVESMKLNVTVQGQKRSLDLATGVTVVDTNGKGLGLLDLTLGSTVELKRSTITVNEKFSQIVVKQLAVNKTADGTITSVDISGKTVTIEEKGTGTVSYPFADPAVLTVKGAPLSGISLLRTGDEIHYQVKASAIAALDVTVPYVEPVDSGKLVDMKADIASPYLTISKGDNKPPLNYLLAKDLAIVIQGITNPVLKDIQVGDELKLDLDKQNAVKKITVTSRSVKNKYMKTIVSYDDATRFLLVDEGGNKPGVYIMTDKTLIESDGRTYTPATFAANFAKGRKIDLTVSGDQNLLAVKMSSSYDGTLAQVNPSSGEYMLKLADEQYVSFKLVTNPTIELVNVSSATAMNLTIGDNVQVTLNSTQDFVHTVKSKKSIMGRLVAVNSMDRQIGVKDNNGTVYSYTLNENIPILVGTRSAVSYNDLPLESPLHLTFVGNAVTKVYAPDVVRGKVTVVDTAQNKLTVESSSGLLTTSVGAKLKVNVNGGISDSLSSVKTGDRVEASADVDGGYRITVAKAEDRSVESYDAYSKIITLKRRNLSDQTTYTFHPKAYIHKGNETFSPNYLLPEDQIRIYLIDNRMIEMEKL